MSRLEFSLQDTYWILRTSSASAVRRGDRRERKMKTILTLKIFQTITVFTSALGAAIQVRFIASSEFRSKVFTVFPETHSIKQMTHVNRGGGFTLIKELSADF